MLENIHQQVKIIQDLISNISTTISLKLLLSQNIRETRCKKLVKYRMKNQLMLFTTRKTFMTVYFNGVCIS